jgi:hypothetical protein
VRILMWILFEVQGNEMRPVGLEPTTTRLKVSCSTS